MKKMTEDRKKKLMYGGMIALIILFIVVLNISVRKGTSVDEGTLETEKTNMVTNEKDKGKEATTNEEPVLKDKRTAQEVAIHFTTNLFSYSEEGVGEIQKDMTDDLTRAVELERKGKRQQEVSNVEISSYEPVQETKHIVLTYQVKGAEQTVFLVVQELEGGFKVIDFQGPNQVYSDLD